MPSHQRGQVMRLRLRGFLVTAFIAVGVVIGTEAEASQGLGCYARSCSICLNVEDEPNKKLVEINKRWCGRCCTPAQMRQDCFDGCGKKFSWGSQKQKNCVATCENGGTSATSPAPVTEPGKVTTAAPVRPLGKVCIIAGVPRRDILPSDCAEAQATGCIRRLLNDQQYANCLAAQPPKR